MSRPRRNDHPSPAAALPRGSAFTKDIARTVRGTLKRFVALAVITALGVTMLTGLKASCDDLRRSADAFFDEQGLFDIRVQSTLGLTDEDIDALAALDGVEAAEGGYAETVYTQVGATTEKVDLRALSDSGMNEPLVVEGHLPERDDQIAVTERFLRESGLYLGDTITFHGAEDDADDSAESDEDELEDIGDATSSTEIFERKEYTIIATVLDPMNINGGEEAMNFRASGGANYTFFVLDDNVIDPGVYTVAYLTVKGAEAPLCYSDEYDQIVNDVKQSVEDARAERERARGEGLRADATEQVDEAEAEANEQLADAERELTDAQAEIDSGRAELDDAERELADQEASAHRQLGDAQSQINDGYAQLAAAEEEINAQSAQVESGLAQMAAELGTSVDGIPGALSANHDTLVASRASLETVAGIVGQLAGSSWPAAEWNALANATSAAAADTAAANFNAKIQPFISSTQQTIADIITIVQSDAVQDYIAQYQELPEEQKHQIEQIIAGAEPAVQEALHRILNGDVSQLVGQLQNLSATVGQASQLGTGMAEVVKGEIQLAEAQSGYQTLISARAQIAAGRDEVAAGRAELDAGATQLSSERASALAQIADGWNQIESGRAELADGQAELDEGRAAFEEERADALDQIADAREQVADIPDAVWYVQDRSSLAGYASVDSDASSIEAIGTVIPVVFFVVAVLISLTTMTRMVEEERGLIGLYKALGYHRGRILSKYALYALAACLTGGIVGALCGFLVLPAIIFTIFKTMYALPALSFGFDPAQLLLAVALFAVGIVGATLLACVRELRETPASLMRPKAPRAGSRILLEHIGPVWSRLGFLNKVTARNLFRYKRRLLMTVFGVAGCVALLITGFGIRDTVISLSARQYGDTAISRYDLLAVTTADDLDGVVADLEDSDDVDELVRAHIDNVTVGYGDGRETMQMIVVADDAPIADYINLMHEDGSAIELGSAGAVITKNAEQVLGVTPGSTIELQDSTLATGEVAVADISLNYLSNMVILTQSAYEEAFGEPAEENGVLATLTGSDSEQIAFGENLSEDGRLLTVVTTATLVRDFSAAFTLINTVVYVVIVLAAALSFTVVFTLSNTNISERDRELATIKVLGFRKREVHRYINKETILLTLMGIVAGMPIGYALARSLTWILKMPSLYFDVVVEPLTYVIAAVLAFVFTLMVNLITNRSLDRIDMVGALKSAE